MNVDDRDNRIIWVVRIAVIESSLDIYDLLIHFQTQIIMMGIDGPFRSSLDHLVDFATGNDVLVKHLGKRTLTRTELFS